MTPVAKRFWITTVRIVPGRGPGCTSGSRITFAANCKGRNQALGLLTSTGRAWYKCTYICGAQEQAREDLITFQAAELINGHCVSSPMVCGAGYPQAFRSRFCRGC